MSRKKKKTLIRIILAAVLLVVLHFIPLDQWLGDAIVSILPDSLKGGDSDLCNTVTHRITSIVIYLIPYLIVGLDVLKGAVRKIGKGDFLDEEFLMVIATFGAFAIGDYPEATAVMLFYQVGELFPSIAVDRSRKSISSLMDICPESATVLREGREETVDPSEGTRSR